MNVQERIAKLSLEEKAALLQGWTAWMTRAKSLPARLLGKLLQSLKDKADKKGTPDLNIMFVYNMPFRALSKLSMGLASDKMADDLVFWVNGHFFRGLYRLIRDFFKNLSATKKFKKLLSPDEKPSC